MTKPANPTKLNRWTAFTVPVNGLDDVMSPTERANHGGPAQRHSYTVDPVVLGRTDLFLCSKKKAWTMQ